MKPLLCLCGVLMLLTGCVASSKHEVYYIAYEPSTQTAALYRLQVEIAGIGGVIYKLSEGYVPASVADALAGNMKEPSDLYAPLSEAQQRSLLAQDIEKARAAKLLEMAAAPGVPEDAGAVNRLTRYYGALQAAAHLDTSEQVSVGQTGTTDPYGYRKLVYFASTQVINIQEFEAELDAIQSSASDIAQMIKQQRQAEAARVQAKAQRRHQMLQGLPGLISSRRNGDLSKWTGVDALEFLAAVQGGL